MKKKQALSMSPDALADYLENLAQQVRTGTLTIDQRTWRIPQQIDLKAGYKEKKGILTTKLRWRWSSVADYSQQERQALDDWKGSLKAVKKRMGQTFKDLQKSVNTGNLPDRTTVEAFAATCAQFTAVADGDWQAEMDEFNDHLADFMRAVDQEQIEIAQHELRDLTSRFKACHREYK
jgi:XXXCH domain-containing protein